MRIHLIAGFAVVLAAGTAFGQDSNNQKPVPGRASLPSTPMFRGGFARIGPAPTTSNSPPANPNTSAPVAARLAPSGAPQSSSDSAHAGEHHHDCKGQCDHDNPASGKPEQAPVAGEPGASHTTEQPSRKPATSDAYCASCHPHGIPQAKAAERVSQTSSPDTRIAAIRDLRSRETSDARRVIDQRLPARTDVLGPSSPGRPPAPAPETPSPGPAVDQPALASVDDLTEQLAAHPDDSHVMRELAVAQLAAKHLRQATETMTKAYRADPLLSKEPLDAKALGLSKVALSSLANAAATNAKTSKTPQAWLLAAVMLQAQDARPQALAAVDSARGAGLDAELCDWMATSLKTKPKQLADAK